MVCIEEFCRENDAVCDENLPERREGECEPLQQLELSQRVRFSHDRAEEISPSEVSKETVLS